MRVTKPDYPLVALMVPDLAERDSVVVAPRTAPDWFLVELGLWIDPA